MNGGWTDFDGWSECSEDCGTGTQNRTRSCTNPTPEHGGRECEGDSSENQDCNTLECPVDGGWSAFEEWPGCCTECGTETQTRTRSCTNPTPEYGGEQCEGSATETRSYDTLIPPCPSKILLTRLEVTIHYTVHNIITYHYTTLISRNIYKYLVIQ